MCRTGVSHTPRIAYAPYRIRPAPGKKHFHCNPSRTPVRKPLAIRNILPRPDRRPPPSARKDSIVDLHCTDQVFEGLRQGREEGLTQGREEKRLQGREEERRNFVRSLLANGFALADIAKATALDEKEILQTANIT